MKMPSPAATSAVRTASFRWCCRRGPIGSDLLDLGLAEQSGRPEDQHQDGDAEYRDVLVLAREIAGPEALSQADQQPDQHGAGQRADAAPHCCGEGLDPRTEPDEEID